jgi:hypothetical protein
MFWWQYRIAWLPGAEESARDPARWLRCESTFRSVPFDVVARAAWCGGRGPAGDVVSMRGLFVDLGAPPTWWERAILWWRRWRVTAVPPPGPAM